MMAPGHGAAWEWLLLTSTSARAQPMAAATASRTRSANGVVMPTRSAARMAIVVDPSMTTSAVTSSGSAKRRGATARRTYPSTSTGKGGLMSTCAAPTRMLGLSCPH